MDTQRATRGLFDDLQKEFCPTLDSSLIGALLAEIEHDFEGNTTTPTQDQIDTLRGTLMELSLQADECQQSELSDVYLTSQLDGTISSWTTPDVDTDNIGNSSANGSGSSETSTRPFSSLLGFLQTTLPDVSTSRLQFALEGSNGADVDLWDFVANVLTEEFIREMEERGLDDLGSEGDHEIEHLNWETAQKKNVAKKKKARSKKIIVADIRQHHHAEKYAHRKNGSRVDSTSVTSATPVPDPWIQLSSISTQLSSLLPPHPPSTFSSFFHSPDYANSYDALHAALTSLVPKSTTIEEKHTTILFNLLDVVMPEIDDTNAEQRFRIISDAELAVAATEGRGDDALDIVSLLRELDSDPNMGLNHLPAPQSPKSDSLSMIAKGNSTAPLKARKPPGTSDHPSSTFKPKLSPSSSKPNPFQWQAVPQRQVISRTPHPLVHHMPAYTRDVNGTKAGRNAESRNIGKKAANDTTDFRQRMNRAMAKRDQALLNAAVMWQKGNSNNRGGDVALYYAERARELQQVAKQEALNAARVMVLSNRAATGNADTIDLHGTTVAEAIVIVKEILNDPSSSISQAKPMKIITGRGTHSVGRVSVLKPAIRKALVDDGWTVASWDAGLIVRSRRT